MTTEPKIYVACLASYNAGVLHGLWIDASTDLDAMQLEINNMLAASRFPNVNRQKYEDEDGAIRFVDAMTPADKIPADWKAIGEPFPSAEEWAIHDYEGLGADLGEYAGLAEVARRVAIVELSEERNIPAAVLLEFANDYMSGDWDVDALESEIDDRFDGSADTWAEFTEERFTETGGMEGVPESLQYYIDFERMARDWSISGDWSAYSADGSLYFFRTC